MESTRLVGDYELGPKIGFGSFAVVWLAKHRISGLEVAIKEIDKKLLNPKVKDNLLKEISILSTINHPNIIRFYESIETGDRIYLVLEYCSGGDLANYINHHGRVSEAVARHFMKQLASGLQVLQENHFIHRDLKPQNLLLSSKEVTPVLKIGDFGFARSLTPNNMAETFCGSPLYMAPEIIRNQKYDAKADLWSAGAILFQLVTGKPPFDGTNHIQLFHNIVRDAELKFPEDTLNQIHPDCVHLCKSLLRRNPIERLSFHEFFNHMFLQDPRQPESSSSTSSSSQIVMPQWDKTKKEIEAGSSSNQSRVLDSLELIEREYVLVKRPSTSMEDSDCFETSLQDSVLLPNFIPKASLETQRSVPSTSDVAEKQLSDVSGSSNLLIEMQRLAIVDHPTKLLILHQYAQTLTEMAREMENAEQVKESFAVTLVVLAIWKKALEICDSWMESIGEGNMSSRTESVLNSDILSFDLSSPDQAKSWVTEEFVAAFNQAENSSTQLNKTSGGGGHMMMPDAMEIIYEKALTYGKSGGAEEYLNNKKSAGNLYKKAIQMLSFLLEEAMTLSLNPPFSLTSHDKNRIRYYIANLKHRHSHL